MQGVYKITNIINNKVYIGCSKDIETRWQKHKYESNNSKHPQYNYSIHKAFRKYGIENFKFEIIEECENYFEREIFWIAYYNSYYNGYNETKGGETGPQLIGESNPNSILLEKEVYDIRNRILKGENPDFIFEDYKNKISKRHFERIKRGENWDKILKTEIKQYIKSEEYKNNIKKWILEKRNKNKENINNLKQQGKSWKEVYSLYDNQYTELGFKDLWYSLPKNENTYKHTRGQKVVKIDKNTNIILEKYNSAAEAARDNNCDASRILKVCKGKGQTAGGYKWKYDNMG